MSKTVAILCLTTILVSLSGCALTKPQDNPGRCDQLQRAWTYNTTNLNHEATWATDTQKQQLKQQLQENHCTLTE